MTELELLADYVVVTTTPDEVYRSLSSRGKNHVSLSVLDPSGSPVAQLLLVFNDNTNPERVLPLIIQHLRGYTTRISRLRSSLSRIRPVERGSVSNIIDSGDEL